MNESMQKVRYQKMLLVLLMLVFGSPVFGGSIFSNLTMVSAKVSCEYQIPTSESTGKTMNPDMMGYSQHLKLNLSIGSVTFLDCCPDCYCSVSGCSAFAVLPATHHVFLTEATLLTNHYNELVDNQLTTSLYRPPISR